MQNLDVRTLSLVSTIIPAVIGIVFATAALGFAGRSRHAAGWWAFGFLLQAIGFLFIYLRGSIPDLLSIPLANTLIIAEPVTVLWGIDRYSETRLHPAFGLAWLAATVVFVMAVTCGQPAFNMRAFAVSMILLAINTIIGIKLLALRSGALAPQRVTAIIFLASAASMAVRAGVSIAGPAQSSLFVSSLSSIIAFVNAFIAPICIGVGLLSMVTRKMQIEREDAIRDLESALGTVNTLSGLLPICASCKRIRDEDGRWDEVEVYVRGHSKAQFSHSICPDCAARLYPGYTPGRTKN